MARRSLWLLAGLSLLIVLVPFALAADAPEEEEFKVEVEYGIEEYVKSGAWFPVRVRPLPGAVAFEVRTLGRDYSGGGHFPVGRYFGEFPGGGRPGAVSCRLEHPAIAIQCTVFLQDGSSRKSKVLSPDFVEGDDDFVLVVTDTPEQFRFLGSIRSPHQGGFHPVVASAETFPRGWLDLSGVDIVILDGSEKQAFSTRQKQALLDWIAGGGTVVLTQRAIALGPDKGSWSLFDEAACAGQPHTISASVVEGFTGKFSEYLTELQTQGLTVPERYRVLWSGADTVIAGKDLGRGRIVGLGFDWKELKVKDHVIYESVREVLWRGIMSLQRPDFDASLDDSHVIPREARAKFLVWYIVIFLVLYVLALALVNWLILRGVKRMEYSVMTLPVGALVFACLSFGIGFALRGDKTIIHEAESMFAEGSGRVQVHSLTGILSPTTKPYRLTGGRPGVVLYEKADDYGFWGFQRPTVKGDKAYFFGERMALGGLEIGMWTMGFFPSTAVEHLGEPLEARAEFSKDGIAGTIRNRLPFKIRDAHLLYQWNRVKLGDLEPASSADFTLPLIPQDRLDVTRCPNCGGYHGGGWYSKSFCRKYPMSEDLRLFLETSGNLLPGGRLVLVGWQDREGNAIEVDHEVESRQKRRFCIFPIDVTMDGPEIVIPEGALPMTRSWQPLSESPAAFVDNIRLTALSKVEAILKNETKDEPERRIRYADPFAAELDDLMSRVQQRRISVFGFYLPAMADNLETTKLALRWKLEQTTYEDRTGKKVEPVPFELSAYNWPDSQWVGLRTETNGTYEINLEAPGQFVDLPSTLILFRIKPTDPKSKRNDPTEIFEITYEGHRKP